MTQNLEYLGEMENDEGIFNVYRREDGSLIHIKQLNRPTGDTAKYELRVFSDIDGSICHTFGLKE